MGAIEKFITISQESKFKGWPLVGDYSLGAKIPFFGQTLEYNLETGNGVEHYVSILRYFGWCVVFGVTAEHEVITLVQWKPGVNQASWELPPGGIGKIPPDMSHEHILETARSFYLQETGYGGGEWTRLGHVMIETGKYRGASPNDHGLPAHLMLATNLEKKSEARNSNPNEIMEILMVSMWEFYGVIDSGLFVETSAVACALLALRKLRL